MRAFKSFGNLPVPSGKDDKKQFFTPSEALQHFLKKALTFLWGLVYFLKI